jgi:hypothetical protein
MFKPRIDGGHGCLSFGFLRTGTFGSGLFP